jgi:hypothetical protein
VFELCIEGAHPRRAGRGCQSSAASVRYLELTVYRVEIAFNISSLSNEPRGFVALKM